MPETLVRTTCSSGPIRQNGQEKLMVTSETSSRPLGVMPSTRRKPTVRGGRGSSRSRLPPFPHGFRFYLVRWSRWRNQELGRFTVEQGDHRYRLDTGRVLDEIECGEDLRYVADFLERHHRGPLPEYVSHWLQELAANRGALKRSARVLEGRTLIVPSSKERSFRNRLKELGYLLDR